MRPEPPIYMCMALWSSREAAGSRPYRRSHATAPPKEARAHSHPARPPEFPVELGLPAAGRKAGRSVGEMEIADWPNR